MAGYQVAVLVPTTLLAQQHHQTFSERFAGHPVRVEVLSRFLTNAQARAVVEGLGSGQVDVVIGTHRLLSGDITFKRLGLLVVDEEQRFGVSHKESIKQFRAEVDSIVPLDREADGELGVAPAGGSQVGLALRFGRNADLVARGVEEVLRLLIADEAEPPRRRHPGFEDALAHAERAAGGLVAAEGEQDE